MADYELVIEATGEVRDADGNLVEQFPVRETRVISEDEARAAGLLNKEEDQK